MATNNKNPIYLFIIGFVTIVVGLAFLPTVANQVAAASILSAPTNTTITFANNTAISLGNTNLLSGTEEVYGRSGVAMQKLNAGGNPNPNYTINLDTGKITLVNATPDDWYNKTSLNVTYIYKPSGYVDGSTSQTLVKLVLIFYAMMVMTAGVYLVVEGFKAIGLWS